MNKYVPTNGGAQAKQAVSPGINNCIWPETASSDTPIKSCVDMSVFLLKPINNTSQISKNGDAVESL